MSPPKCPRCGQRMLSKIYDEDEGEWYFECENLKPDGAICWETIWEHEVN